MAGWPRPRCSIDHWIHYLWLAVQLVHRSIRLDVWTVSWRVVVDLSALSDSTLSQHIRTALSYGGRSLAVHLQLALEVPIGHQWSFSGHWTVCLRCERLLCYPCAERSEELKAPLPSWSAQKHLIVGWTRRGKRDGRVQRGERGNGARAQSLGAKLARWGPILTLRLKPCAKKHWQTSLPVPVFERKYLLTINQTCCSYTLGVLREILHSLHLENRLFPHAWSKIASRLNCKNPSPSKMFLKWFPDLQSCKRIHIVWVKHRQVWSNNGRCIPKTDSLRMSVPTSTKRILKMPTPRCNKNGPTNSSLRLPRNLKINHPCRGLTCW